MIPSPSTVLETREAPQPLVQEPRLSEHITISLDNAIWKPNEILILLRLSN